MATVYRDMFRERVLTAVATARAAHRVSHAGLKGQMREILVRDLLRPLLPMYIGIGSGAVISHNGEQSPQQDIVIYDTRLLPPLMADPNLGLFPKESVLYCIEVKSKLTLEEIRKAHSAALKIKNLPLVSGHYDVDDIPQETQVLAVYPTLFAFDSDLTTGGQTEIERYNALLAGSKPALLNICVVGRGFWAWFNDHWEIGASSDSHEEVTLQLISIFNNYGKIALSRGLPRLEAYLLDIGPDENPQHPYDPKGVPPRESTAQAQSRA